MLNIHFLFPIYFAAHFRFSILIQYTFKGREKTVNKKINLSLKNAVQLNVKLE